MTYAELKALLGEDIISITRLGYIGEQAPDDLVIAQYVLTRIGVSIEDAEVEEG